MVTFQRAFKGGDIKRRADVLGEMIEKVLSLIWEENEHGTTMWKEE